ncbi:hypothetical protein JCM6292_3454 [Bacteroides pyogenes JCM 6292]|uniref:Uncharacterized protein n=2 Tax=Bacteroides pyogenes TaxID=310300 RepID=W4PKQ4_9BACE|nr:hypothetical protein JCM6292_3454 [Bacteroides pyogenes JCM 6292]GAE20352.1 hypothetical protein JCM6294_3537 [Bacteroides pyogenes DSM 20611 = JCM 6294]
MDVEYYREICGGAYSSGSVQDLHLIPFSPSVPWKWKDDTGISRGKYKVFFFLPCIEKGKSTCNEELDDLFLMLSAYNSGDGGLKSFLFLELLLRCDLMRVRQSVRMPEECFSSSAGTSCHFRLR